MNTETNEPLILGPDEIAIVVKFDDTDWGCLHDAVMDSTGKELERDELEALFKELPRSIQFTALEWGMSDTVFGDEVWRHLQPQKEEAVAEVDNEDGREPMLRLVCGKKGVGKSNLLDSYKEITPQETNMLSEQESATVFDAVKILKKSGFDIRIVYGLNK